MTTILVSALLLVHGAIHILGVVKAFGLAELPQLAQPIARSWGVAWGACAALLVGAAVARLVSWPLWWLPAGVGVAASQVVIIAFWGDARFGTVANVLLLVPVLVGLGQWRFASQVERDVAALQRQADAEGGSVVTEAELDGLPPVVAAWLRRAGVVGRPRATAVFVRQTGELQTSPDGDWLAFRARQWFSATPPAFVWVADVDGPVGTSLAGRDTYLRGAGAMRIELLALIPVVDARGATIDQGAAVRYLAETMWFPAAVLEPCISWEAIDDRSARATLRHAGLEVSGVFHFDESGDPIGFQARRYRDDALQDWIIDNDPSAMAVVDGVRIPTRSTVTWRDDDGERWTWLRLVIEGMDRAASPAPTASAAAP